MLSLGGIESWNQDSKQPPCPCNRLPASLPDGKTYVGFAEAQSPFACWWN
jgi:hypothetical protein